MKIEKRVNIGLWYGIRDIPVKFGPRTVFEAHESIGETRQILMSGDEFFQFVDDNGSCKIRPYEGELYVYFSDTIDGGFGQK